MSLSDLSRTNSIIAVQCVAYRLAAVHGAIYVLRQPVSNLLLDPETHHCRGIQTSTGQVTVDVQQPCILNYVG